MRNIRQARVLILPMRSVARFAVLALVVAGQLACHKDPLAEPEPAEPRALRQYLMQAMPDVLRNTECQCCKKPLYACFAETLSGEGPHCPDT